MSWTVDIPCRDEDEHLDMLTIRETCRAIEDPSQRDIASYLLERLSNEYGADSFGEALSLIGQADPATRGRLLDDARAEAGQPSIREVDDARELAAARRDDLPPPPSLQAGPPRDPQGFAAQTCAADGCVSYPVDHLGEPARSRAVRWWCPRHVHEAQEGDMDDWEIPQFSYGPAGLERKLSPSDEAFYREIDRRREDEDEERRQQREAEAKVAAAARERWQREHGGEGVSIAGVRPSQVRL